MFIGLNRISVAAFQAAGGGSAPAPSFPLDSLTAGAAYSVRRLRTDYTGPLLRVRRSNDNAEQDIGYDVNGRLDQSALTSFAGVNSAFVTTWYDQSGNARHVSQATTTAQPRIVNSGVVDVEKGSPTLVFDGNQTAGQGDFLFNASPFMYAAGQGSFFFMMKSLSTERNKRIWSEGRASTGNPVYRLEAAGLSNSLAALIRNDAGSIRIDNNISLFADAFDNTLRAYAWRDGAAQITGYRDSQVGSTLAYTREGVLTLDRFGIGIDMRTTPSAPIVMSLSEAIFIPSALLESEIFDLQDDQNSFFFNVAPSELLAQINGTGDGGPSFSVNLGGVPDGEEPVFIDRAKQGRGWRGQGLLPLTAGLDANGNPIALNAGDTSFDFFFSAFRDGGGVYVNPLPERGGRFRVTWEGDALFEIRGGSNRVDLTANSFEFDCDWISNKSFGVTPTNPANLPRNIKIIDVNLLSNHAAGEVFDPLYLSTLPTGGCLRFMDWMGTNNSPVVSVADYPVLSSQRWDRVPFEAMVALCNLKSADMWICIPHQANDDFVQQKLEYIRDNLNPTLKVRVELSNEIWNTGTFNHPTYFKNLAQSVWGVPDGFSNNLWLAYAGKRFAQIMQIAQAIFSAAPTRLIGVVGGQAAVTNVANVFLNATAWQTFEPGSYIRPGLFAKEISIAPYLNWTGNRVTAGNALAPLVGNQPAFEDYVIGMTTASLAQSKTWIDNHVLLAAQNNCRLTMYEYNQHYSLAEMNGSALVSGGVPIAGALEAMVAATLSSRMAEAQDELRDYFKSQSGSLMCFFVNMNRSSRFGTWGAQTHIGHNSPIWNAILAWHAANPRWYSQ